MQDYVEQLYTDSDLEQTLRGPYDVVIDSRDLHRDRDWAIKGSQRSCWGRMTPRGGFWRESGRRYEIPSFAEMTRYLSDWRKHQAIKDNAN